MKERTIEEAYFIWLMQFIGDDANFIWWKLVGHLHDAPFVYTIPLDENRWHDGVELRFRFGKELGYKARDVHDYLNRSGECSILEMMVALSLRCEENIMTDPDFGNRTGQWFWNMIISLGLRAMDDAQYDERHVNRVLARFIDRRYKPSGEGGLFTIPNCRYDLRTVEIWYQAMWYLTSIM